MVVHLAPRQPRGIDSLVSPRQSFVYRSTTRASTARRPRLPAAVRSCPSRRASAGLPSRRQKVHSAVRRLPPAQPFRSQPRRAAGEEDIVDETLGYFKANVLFKHFEVKGAADRTLIYLTLYTTQCLKRLETCPTQVPHSAPLPRAVPPRAARRGHSSLRRIVPALLGPWPHCSDTPSTLSGTGRRRHADGRRQGADGAGARGLQCAGRAALRPRLLLPRRSKPGRARCATPPPGPEGRTRAGRRCWRRCDRPVPTAACASRLPE